MENNYTIRNICITDNNVVAEIIRNTFIEFNLPKNGTVFSDPTTNDLFSLFNIPRAACFVAEIANRVVGSAGIFPSSGLPADYCEFSKFYLLPEARGKGIGKKLLEECIECAKNFGYKNLYLESFPGLPNALKMYEKFGFRSLQSPLGNSGHHACSVWQLLDLE